jgi:uncharacterized protein (TIGR04255 family)
MSLPDEITIALAEPFERLPSAPIVEAVIHWKAPSGKSLDKDALRNELNSRFADYELREQHEFDAAMQTSADAVEWRQQTRWSGFRLAGQGNADRYVVQFKPNGVAFSRLKPYDHWEPFLAAAMPFWNAYLELAQPPLVERLGVRFINQISLIDHGSPSEYLRDLPATSPALGLSSVRFFHQDTYRVSGYPYQINWIRTVQPTQSTDDLLIVDIDVWTERIDSLDSEILAKHLAEMRFLKNKLFFSSMTERAIQNFRRERHE